MNKDWEYAGFLMDSFKISVRHIEPFTLSEYPGKWVATMKKSPLGVPAFTVSAWGSSACDAVINCYNKSHSAQPENVYEGNKVFITKESGSRPYTLRHYEPGTKQHGKEFDSYIHREAAITAAKQYNMELVDG